MTVTFAIMSIVLVAAVIAWMRTRRIVGPAGADRDDEPEAPHERGPVEIWISLAPTASAQRARIVEEIARTNLGVMPETGSETDILLETADPERAQREVRAILAKVGIVATMSVTRAADGDVN
ncbi:MAG TPA: hypothetical protein VF698_07095 [Thermoanaerobaculia bacterium]|jgi:hypothetical protein